MGGTKIIQASRLDARGNDARSVKITLILRVRIKNLLVSGVFLHGIGNAIFISR